MIVTHINPDWDAIASVWLLKRYFNLDSEEVVFVNTGNPDKELLEKAIAVVDTGKEFDFNNLRFDHHQLPEQESNNTCAAKMVYEHINDGNLDYLESLINLVFYGDTGKKEASFSRDLGIHALLSGYKAESHSDEDILNFGFRLLNILDSRLINQVKAKSELESKIVYKSYDGLLVAIKHGGQGSSFAAFDEGARLVIFEGTPIQIGDNFTYPIGIQRNSEWGNPHTGILVDKVIDIVKGCGEETPEYAIHKELNKWFKHNAGFFSGRGTSKAPDYESVNIDLKLLASFIDMEWER